ncbi:hypothetical protein WDW86_02250 [Bdellovibrionota bacterium FG-2]
MIARVPRTVLFFGVLILSFSLGGCAALRAGLFEDDESMDSMAPFEDPFNPIFGGHNPASATGFETPAAIPRLSFTEESRSPAQARYLQEIEEQPEMSLSRAFERGEIIVGMGMHEVKFIWGDPKEVEVAGSSYDGNQRWIYYAGLSARKAIEAATAKIVYFEEGRVVGWEIP